MDRENEQELIREMEKLNRRVPESAKTEGEIFPGDTPAVIARSRGQGPGCFAMKWGYNGRIINARSESADILPTFRASWYERRCLLPAGYYYEWQNKTKYAIRPADKTMMLLAGLYRLTPDGPECVVLTRACTKELAYIHDRMPVMLAWDDLEEWLDPSGDPRRVMERALLKTREEACGGR